MLRQYRSGCGRTVFQNSSTPSRRVPSQGINGAIIDPLPEKRLAQQQIHRAFFTLRVKNRIVWFFFETAFSRSHVWRRMLDMFLDHSAVAEIDFLKQDIVTPEIGKVLQALLRVGFLQ